MAHRATSGVCWISALVVASYSTADPARMLADALRESGLLELTQRPPSIAIATNLAWTRISPSQSSRSGRPTNPECLAEPRAVLFGQG